MKINEVYEGDCLEVMRGFPDNCIDTILTDPPYELDFMNKKWDSSGIAFDSEVWAEALRVAKPGATLMAFGGSRTYHRLTCAIEDAGWEIRDCISYFNDGTQQERALMTSLDEEQLAAYLELHYPSNQMAWVYGQGMGLGKNISKGIDAAKGVERETKRIEYKGNELYRSNGQNTRPWMEEAIENGYHELQGDTPATPLAKTFDGWCSRLKPAFEPIVIAMKPLEGTYANNAEVWGVAGLNIDECRVEISEDDKNHRAPSIINKTSKVFKGIGGRPNENLLSKGRWPANLIHSGEPGVLAEFDKAGVSPSSARPNSRGNSYSNNSDIYGKYNPTISNSLHDDTGTPARYFTKCPADSEPARFRYCPKAPKSERNIGMSGEKTFRLRDDLTEDERIFVMAELEKIGLA